MSTRVSKAIETVREREPVPPVLLSSQTPPVSAEIRGAASPSVPERGAVGQRTLRIQDLRSARAAGAPCGAFRSFSVEHIAVRQVIVHEQGLNRSAVEEPHPIYAGGES